MHTTIRVMHSHVPDQVALVSERLPALGALVRLLSGRRGHVQRVMVQVLMPLQQLLLSEGLITLVALEWFLISMN